ncbi:hypothetical protein MKZ38_002242 [Zalerion maritima]|uniref:Uncharacterized protein n=1 Tax=Zalerion maritima TaxID=339359 RepID=A0AAD5RP66_9PEZI|nr:hypothetical protein MKZ38_002242 [Zalerion maritima]
MPPRTRIGTRGSRVPSVGCGISSSNSSSRRNPRRKPVIRPGNSGSKNNRVKNDDVNDDNEHMDEDPNDDSDDGEEDDHLPDYDEDDNNEDDENDPRESSDPDSSAEEDSDDSSDANLQDSTEAEIMRLLTASRVSKKNRATVKQLLEQREDQVRARWEKANKKKNKNISGKDSVGNKNYAQLTRRVRELTEQNREFQDLTAVWEEEVKDMDKKLEESDRERKNLEKASRDYKKNNAALAGDNRNLRAQLRVAGRGNRGVDRNRKQRETAENPILNQQVGQLTEQNRELVRQTRKLQELLQDDDEVDMAGEWAADIQELSNQISDGDAKIAELENRLQEAQREIARLKPLARDGNDGAPAPTPAPAAFARSASSSTARRYERAQLEDEEDDSEWEARLGGREGRNLLMQVLSRGVRMQDGGQERDQEQEQSLDPSEENEDEEERMVMRGGLSAPLGDPDYGDDVDDHPTDYSGNGGSRFPGRSRARTRAGRAYRVVGGGSRRHRPHPGSQSRAQFQRRAGGDRRRRRQRVRHIEEQQRAEDAAQAAAYNPHIVPYSPLYQHPNLPPMAPLAPRPQESDILLDETAMEDWETDRVLDMILTIIEQKRIEEARAGATERDIDLLARACLQAQAGMGMTNYGGGHPDEELRQAGREERERFARNATTALALILWDRPDAMEPEERDEVARLRAQISPEDAAQALQSMTNQEVDSLRLGLQLAKREIPYLAEPRRSQLRRAVLGARLALSLLDDEEEKRIQLVAGYGAVDG